MMAIPLIGGAISAVGQVMGAGARRKAAQYNAAVSRNNARTSRYEAQVEIADKRKEMRQTLGSIRAAYGASGIQFIGSGLSILRDTASEYAWDEQKIAYKGEVKAAGEQDQAKLYDMEAKQAGTEGMIGAATSLLKGGVGAYSMYSRDTYGAELG